MQPGERELSVNTIVLIKIIFWEASKAQHRQYGREKERVRERAREREQERETRRERVSK